MKRVKVGYYIVKEVEKEIDITAEEWEILNSDNWEDTFRAIEEKVLVNENDYREESFSIRDGERNRWWEY